MPDSSARKLRGGAARLLWPWLRDRGLLGGAAGLFADWPTLTVFFTSMVGWNPHSGYFMFSDPPRRRIGALLKDPRLFPHRDRSGREMDEQDGTIRYRRVLISV